MPRLVSASTMRESFFTASLTSFSSVSVNGACSPFSSCHPFSFFATMSTTPAYDFPSSYSTTSAARGIGMPSCQASTAVLSGSCSSTLANSVFSCTWSAARIVSYTVQYSCGVSASSGWFTRGADAMQALANRCQQRANHIGRLIDLTS